MKTLITLLFACCFGSAMAQSNLPDCRGAVSKWTSCSGKFVFANGDEFAATFLDGKPHGLGSYTFADGYEYLDNYVLGVKSGYSRTSSARGSILSIGHWINNQTMEAYPMAPTRGSKILTLKASALPNCPLPGNKFDGCFGIYISQWTGRKYVGEFKNDKIHGRGVLFEDDYRSGETQRIVQEGLWEAGVFQKNTPVRLDQARVSAIDKEYLLVAQERRANAKFAAAAIQKVSVASKVSTEPTFVDSKIENKEPQVLDMKPVLLNSDAEQTPATTHTAQQQTQVKPAAQIAPQGKRVALVIGNAKYKFSPLNNPVNDATDMAASLRSVGFDVIVVKDATLKQMRAATRQFADKLEVSDVGLVYYSGHGIEVKGKNYLIPVNADIRREYEVVDQAFDASNLLRMMESLQSGTKKRVNILIVDACRNNDLPKSWRSTNSGLARMDAPAGSFISFATAPGQVASDGQGRNSPYTKHLLQALKQPGMPIEQVFKQVRRNVMDETGGEQVPWENSSLIGDFYFTVAR